MGKNTQKHDYKIVQYIKNDEFCRKYEKQY